ncbi:single-stranded-DNA-specific exonuclease RecJ [Persicimonas caeni]|uniref:single-stranded-DNA-specific exonuclease RecJ n=1 Tax=Persicimonas caeni TaxID=2292766 RepID=UPI00143D8751|nr:single-stranded-DNA-specific exonuclease RecJ [Persicimonas caeni]
MNSGLPRNPREWVLKRCSSEQCVRLSREFELHPLTARLLVQRGIYEPQAAHDFLNPTLSQMIDPFTMKGMKRAVREMLVALDGGERIVIHGDYDVDGVCSVSVLYTFLRALGANVGYYVPLRDQDGYGLNAQTVRRLAAEGCDLLVTTDCGVSNVEEIKLARDLGLRVVVIDHHSVPEVLPPANAILNPLQIDCDYAFKELAAVGVVFNFVVALRKELRSRGVFRHVPEPDVRDLLDLVALGTIADVVPLVGQNRLYVHHGLDILAQRKRAGVSALLERVSRPESGVNTQTVSFGLAPRLNAAGRLGDASICVELLTTRSYRKALELAKRLEALNGDRQELERGILGSALPQAQSQVDALRKILVVAGVDWPRGVLGIVASRLMDRFHRPTIMVGIEDGEAKGSARSIEGVDILSILDESAELLSTYGGHTSAAGLSFVAENLEELRDSLNEAADRLLDAEPLPKPSVRLDGEVELGSLDDRFVRDLKRLEPFGTGNREPIFLAPQSQASRVRVVGTNHLRARFRDGTGALDGIGFSLAGLEPLLSDSVAIAFSPRYSVFRGRGRLEMHIKDIRSASETIPDRIEQIEH